MSRTEIASVETQAPVKQVEVIGSKPKSLAYTGGGSKSDWLAASNIPRDAWGYADFMVQKESGWNQTQLTARRVPVGLRRHCHVVSWAQTGAIQSSRLIGWMGMLTDDMAAGKVRIPSGKRIVGTRYGRA